jgi:hypothetical protein
MVKGKTVTEWSLECDVRRYERLLERIKSHNFWIGDKPGRPSEGDLQRQVERLQDTLAQLRDTLSQRLAEGKL